MADLRDQIRHDNIGQLNLPYFADGSTIVYDYTKRNGSAAVGKAVTLSADKTVALAADGDAIVGKLNSVEPDGVCNVTVKGWVELPAGNGATVTRGTKIVGALGPSSAKGYIRNAASGTATELVKARGMIEAVGVTTAVEVIL